MAWHIQGAVTVLIAAQREPPYAAIAVFLSLAMVALGVLRSCWRARKYPIFGARKKPSDENHG